MDGGAEPVNVLYKRAIIYLSSRYTVLDISCMQHTDSHSVLLEVLQVSLGRVDTTESYSVDQKPIRTSATRRKSHIGPVRMTPGSQPSSVCFSLAYIQLQCIELIFKDIAVNEETSLLGQCYKG